LEANYKKDFVKPPEKMKGIKKSLGAIRPFQGADVYVRVFTVQNFNLILLSTCKLGLL
jgi:hypothetical protein